MAVNCSVRPLATDGFTGATAIEVNAAAVTVRVSLGLVIPPRAAVMVDVPVASVEANAGSGGRSSRPSVVRRRPGDLGGEVGGRAVGVGPGGRELLCEALGDRGVGRRHRDRGQRSGASPSGCRLGS